MKISNKEYKFYGPTIDDNLEQYVNTSWKVKPTYHAIEESKKDRYGEFDLLDFIPRKFQVKEICQRGSKITKFVLRFRYNDEVDMHIVIRPSLGYYVLVSAWLNLPHDHHKTLNLSNYDKAKFYQKPATRSNFRKQKIDVRDRYVQRPLRKGRSN